MGYVPSASLSITKRMGSTYKSNATMKVFRDRLRARGVEVNPGERLPYFVVLNGKRTIGECMELQDGYRDDDRHGFPIDYLYYLNNLFKNPLDQVFAIGFSDQLRVLGCTELKESRRRKVVTLRMPITFLARMVENRVSFTALEAALRGECPVKLRVH